MSQDPSKWAGSIVTLVEAFLMLAISLGWLAVDNAQTQLIINVVVAVVAVLAPVFGFVYVRKNATALADPKDVDGTPFLRSDGSMPMKMTPPKNA